MDHINKDKVKHSLSFGFSMTEKEDRSKKKRQGQKAQLKK